MAPSVAGRRGSYCDPIGARSVDLDVTVVLTADGVRGRSLMGAKDNVAKHTRWLAAESAQDLSLGSP